MKRLLYLDIETFSSVDLKKAGVYAYAEASDFEVLMCAYAYEDEPVLVLIGEEEIARQLGGALVDPYTRKVAHNAQFERVCFSAMLGLPAGEYLDPAQWVDTAAGAALVGLPQSLDKLARRLGCAPKDGAGTRLINLFCKPNRYGQRTMPQDEPDKWAQFVAYCAQDVESMRECGPDVLSPALDEPERSVWVADQLVNDRGITLDVDTARRAVAAVAHNREQQCARLCEITGIDNARSVQQIIGWLRERLAVSSLAKANVDELLAGQLDDDVREVLELRRELALSASAKYEAALSGVSRDGRLRGQFRYHGAHTGRWSGRGVQLHNLPRLALEGKTEALARGAEGAELDVLAAIIQERRETAARVDLGLGLGADASTVKALIRSTFVGPFTVADYSAIEARDLAWLAGEQWAIDAFRDGRDIYVETAQRMGGLTRQQGKVATLALGYGGGVKALRVMGAQGSDDELEMLRDQWRKANPRITRYWRRLGEVFEHGGEMPRGVSVEVAGPDRVLTLPSGRTMTYRDVRPRWFGVGEDRRRMLSYVNGLGVSTAIWGGTLTENLTQAVARDQLAEALIRADDAGLSVVGHVHDEILVDGAGLEAELVDAMTTLMRWAPGLPLDAQAFTCERYRKG